MTQLPLFPALPAEIDALCEAGRADACLIDGTICEAIEQFTAAGWEWDGSELRRQGWAAFFRSQGELARAILQWRRAA